MNRSQGQARVKCPRIGSTEESGGRLLLAGRMCYPSEWPKSFLKAFIRHYSYHQVRPGFFLTQVHCLECGSCDVGVCPC